MDGLLPSFPELSLQSPAGEFQPPAIGVRRLEAAPHTSIRARLVKVVRNVPSMMWLTDETGAATFANRRWLEFTGRRLKAELGKGWQESVHSDDVQALRARLNESLRNRQPFAHEFRVRRADGVYRWISGYGLPLYEEYGAFAGYLGTCVDVTDQRAGTSPPQREVERLRLVAEKADGKLEEEELRASRHRLRDFSAHLEQAREQERRELARALHDEVGQLLTAIRLEVTAAVERFKAAPTPATFPIVDRLQAAVGLVDLSIATVQRITTALRPPILDHLGLVAAIKWEAAVFERRTGIRCRVSANPAVLESRQHITVLYRILLEALTNVARHANAGTVWIKLRQRAGRLTMEIRDNGRGISETVLENGTAMGLVGMRERALAVGGEVCIARLRSGGTCVTVSVPLSTSPPGAETAAAHG